MNANLTEQKIKETFGFSRFVSLKNAQIYLSDCVKILGIYHKEDFPYVVTSLTNTQELLNLGYTLIENNQ